jgi:Ca-activated chloride channel family protein
MDAKRIRFLSAVLVCVVAAVAACWIRYADRFSWTGLWLTPDQQGRRAFDKGDYRSAAERFQDPLWKGIAYYRSGDFEAAVGQFVRVETAQGGFNLGDAYAHLGRLEQAQASFEAALRCRPDDRATRENLKLVNSLIQKKEKKKEEKEPPPGEEPVFNPDEIKVDEKGKKGKAGEVNHMPLSDEQIQELWMRRLQTTPSEFLRLKFAIQAGREPETARAQNSPAGGT